MRPSLHFLGVTFFFALLLTALVIPGPVARAQRPLPTSNSVRGLDYQGLQIADSGPCHDGFQIMIKQSLSQHILCSHGPDASPPGVDVRTHIPAPSVNRSSAPESVTCDGDGVTGRRVQLIYAHASDVADRYSSYVSSFRQWAAEMDDIFLKSAQQTGGTRHIRFVTDSSCVPVIPDVSLSPTGDDNISNTVSELQSQGYNLTDRKYVVFADAHVYCGISSTAFDDQSGWRNANNFGDSFGRVDTGCWGSVIPAHELMHELGAVQPSAPHSDGNWHCTDGHDNMCDHGASPNLTFTACPDPVQDSLMDCNHDDYFSTKRLANPYLAAHWNSAVSLFLISPPVSRVDSIVTGRLKGTNLVLSDTFRAPYTVTIRVHVVDEYDFDLRGVKVSFHISRQGGGTVCKFSSVTDRTGNAQGTCLFSAVQHPTGTWDAHVDSLTSTGFPFDGMNSIRDRTFVLR